MVVQSEEVVLKIFVEFKLSHFDSGEVFGQEVVEFVSEEDGGEKDPEGD